MALQTRSRKLAATQAALDSRTGRATGATAPASAMPSRGWFTGYSKNIPSILLVIAAVVVFFAGGLQHLDGNNPDPVSIGSWGRNHWFSLLLLWGIAAALIALNAEKATAKTLQWVLTGVVAAVLAIFPLWGLATSPAAPAHATVAVQQSTSTEECTKLRPCSSLGTVSVLEGKRVCFEPSFWDNLEKLGYMTSYRGEPETRYTCTREQAIAGTCGKGAFDTFRFTPETGVSVPKHWFVPEGVSRC